MRVILLLLLSTLLSGCGYNQIQQKDEAVKAGWSEVLNQYKRRADLIPNLVNTVRVCRAEAQVLTAVTEARAKVSQINVNPTMLHRWRNTRRRRARCRRRWAG